MDKERHDQWMRNRSQRNPVWIPLQGPMGYRPKAPAVGAWQSPGYYGLSEESALVAHRLNRDDWFGLRTDELVVIDIDVREKADWWMERTGPLTWLRSTPRGFHFIYEQTEGSPDAPDADIFGEGSHVDIRAGRTSQIVYLAPGYAQLTPPSTIKPFDPSWLPDNYSVGAAQRLSRDDEAWSEMPWGRGNNTMTAFGGAFRKQGMDAVTIAKCLGAINRITMTQRPMEVEEIVEIAKSVARYSALPDIDIELEEE
jgi:hypothetical protein